MLPWLGLGLLYAILGVAVTWPLADRMSTGIPKRNRKDRP